MTIISAADYYRFFIMAHKKLDALIVLNHHKTFKVIVLELQVEQKIFRYLKQRAQCNKTFNNHYDKHIINHNNIIDAEPEICENTFFQHKIIIV